MITAQCFTLQKQDKNGKFINARKSYEFISLIALGEILQLKKVA